MLTQLTSEVHELLCVDETSAAEQLGVMLRRNIDTETGLVNGAIGTVLSISVL